MKYIKSLLKYIIGIVIGITLFTSIQLLLPQKGVELTYNQAIWIVIIGIIALSIVLKFIFDSE